MWDCIIIDDLIGPQATVDREKMIEWWSAESRWKPVLPPVFQLSGEKT